MIFCLPCDNPGVDPGLWGAIIGLDFLSDCVVGNGMGSGGLIYKTKFVHIQIKYM